MNPLPTRVTWLQQLEARQDAVLRELDELNARLERVLAEFQPAPPAPAAAPDLRVPPPAEQAPAPAARAA